MPNSKSIQILTGSLLSDGSLLKPNKRCKNFYFYHFSASEQYVDHLMKEIEWPTKKYKTKPRVNQPNEKRKHAIIGNGGFYLKTGTTEEFSNLRAQWYPSGFKIVPDDIEITPLVMLHWYLGDGSLDNKRGAVFCTESFDDHSLDILQSKIPTFLDRYLNERRRLVIPNRSVFEMFKYIGEYPPFEDYSHKWDTIVKESYANRKCHSCEKSFDTEINSRYFCSHSCYMKHWRKNGPTLRVACKQEVDEEVQGSAA